MILAGLCCAQTPASVSTPGMYLLAAARNKKVAQAFGSILHHSVRSWDRQASALAREYNPPSKSVLTHMAANATFASASAGKIGTTPHPFVPAAANGGCDVCHVYQQVEQRT